MWLNSVRKGVLAVQSKEFTRFDKVLVEILLSHACLHIQLVLVNIECIIARGLLIGIRKAFVLENCLGQCLNRLVWFVKHWLAHVFFDAHLLPAGVSSSSSSCCKHLLHFDSHQGRRPYLLQFLSN